MTEPVLRKFIVTLAKGSLLRRYGTVLHAVVNTRKYR